MMSTGLPHCSASNRRTAPAAATAYKSEVQPPLGVMFRIEMRLRTPTALAGATAALGFLALAATAAHAGESSPTQPIPYEALVATQGTATAAPVPTAAPSDSPTQPIPYTALVAIDATLPQDVEGEIAVAARANGVDPALVRAVAIQESGMRASARSNRGAMGVMQLTASTAHDLGVDPHDVRQNIQGGAAYLKTLLVAFGGDVSKALAAYNAGPGAVQKYNGVPPFAETRNYVSSIMARMAVGLKAPLPTQTAQGALQVAAGVGLRAAANAARDVGAFAAGASRPAVSNDDPIGAVLAAVMPVSKSAGR